MHKRTQEGEEGRGEEGRDEVEKEEGTRNLKGGGEGREEVMVVKKEMVVEKQWGRDKRKSTRKRR